MKENAVPHETKMKWNQEDLGKAPHRRQGICTSVRGPSPRPTGYTQDILTLFLKSNPGTNEGQGNQPKDLGALLIRRLEVNWIVH